MPVHRSERDAIVRAESLRRDVLAQICNAANACQDAVVLYEQYTAAMEEGGEIGAAWSGAPMDHAIYVAALGESVAEMQFALKQTLAAARSLHLAGEAVGLNLLPGLRQ